MGLLEEQMEAQRERARAARSTKRSKRANGFNCGLGCITG